MLAYKCDSLFQVPALLYTGLQRAGNKDGGHKDSTLISLVTYMRRPTFVARVSITKFQKGNKYYENTRFGILTPVPPFCGSWLSASASYSLSDIVEQVVTVRPHEDPVPETIGVGRVAPCPNVDWCSPSKVGVGKVASWPNVDWCSPSKVGVGRVAPCPNVDWCSPSKVGVGRVASCPNVDWCSPSKVGVGRVAPCPNVDWCSPSKVGVGRVAPCPNVDWFSPSKVGVGRVASCPNVDWCSPSKVGVGRVASCPNVDWYSPRAVVVRGAGWLSTRQRKQISRQRKIHGGTVGLIDSRPCLLHSHNWSMHYLRSLRLCIMPPAMPVQQPRKAHHLRIHSSSSVTHREIVILSRLLPTSLETCFNFYFRDLLHSRLAPPTSSLHCSTCSTATLFYCSSYFTTPPAPLLHVPPDPLLHQLYCSTDPSLHSQMLQLPHCSIAPIAPLLYCSTYSTTPPAPLFHVPPDPLVRQLYCSTAPLHHYIAPSLHRWVRNFEGKKEKSDGRMTSQHGDPLLRLVALCVYPHSPATLGPRSALHSQKITYMCNVCNVVVVVTEQVNVGGMGKHIRDSPICRRRWNEEEGETGDPRENPKTSSIVRYHSHLRKSRVNRLGIEPSSQRWESARQEELKWQLERFGRILRTLPTCWQLRHLNAKFHVEVKIYVKLVNTGVYFAIDSQFIRHALDDSEPIADLQGNT
ncbi:hypothetical protein PR048_018912 [Dryococelus australis]|uniref:Uncharacterized protein n=1 Tax=Dryococelus australis TaxID=614101 RepID=A0ABQ9H246_9NEOP|nr:hypothetical protein PR048_018912 [Dryococelus australis]